MQSITSDIRTELIRPIAWYMAIICCNKRKSPNSSVPLLRNNNAISAYIQFVIHLGPSYNYLCSLCLFFVIIQMKIEIVSRLNGIINVYFMFYNIIFLSYTEAEINVPRHDSTYFINCIILSTYVVLSTVPH